MVKKIKNSLLSFLILMSLLTVSMMGETIKNEKTINDFINLLHLKHQEKLENKRLKEMLVKNRGLNKQKSLNRLLLEYLKTKNPKKLKAIENTLINFKELGNEIYSRKGNEFLLSSLKPLAKALKDSSSMALKVLEYKKANKALKPELDFLRDTELKECKKEYNGIEISICSFIEKVSFLPDLGKEICVLETTLGTLKFRFYEKEAPLTVKHFKELVKKGFYDGKTFYRVVKGHVAQAGGYPEGELSRTIKAEFNSHPHLKGTVGLARGSEPDSGSSEFYICFAPRPHLNGKYTVFGQLISGYDILSKIENTKVKEKFIGDDKKIAFHTPVKKIIIKKAYIEKIKLF